MLARKKDIKCILKIGKNNNVLSEDVKSVIGTLQGSTASLFLTNTERMAASPIEEDYLPANLTCAFVCTCVISYVCVGVCVL